MTTVMVTRRIASQHRGAMHDGAGALAEGPAVGDGPPDFLLDGQEEARRQDERQEPQEADGRERVLAERALGDRQEAVGGDARDDEPEPDGHRALGERVAFVGAIQEPSGLQAGQP